MGSAPERPAGPVRSVKGYCPFCQVRCTYQAQVRDGHVVSLVGETGNRWTGGGMCPKGMSIVELIGSPHRVVEPMLRVGSAWKTISYAEAVDLVADKLQAARATHGPKVAGRLALTAPLWDCRESELAALMTMRLAGGANVMPPGEVCISTASTVLNMLLGAGTSTTTVNEIVNAATLVLWGANISETYPPYSRWLDKARDNGVRIVYIDHRKTRTSAWSSMQLQPLPGTDGALAMGAIRHVLDTGAYDPDRVQQTTTGLDALREDVAAYDPARVAELTGLAREDVAALYRVLAASPRTIIWMGGCLSRYTNGMHTVRSLISLQGLRDNLAGSGKGILTMEGGKPEGEKEFVDRVCGPAAADGVNFRRLLAAMKKGDIDVLFLNSSYRRYPDCGAVREAIKKVGFVVHRGFFLTEEAEVAHLFVPATFSPESQGSHYGAEKQVVWRDKCVDAPGSCVPDWQFYRDVGRKIAPDRYPDFSGPEELNELFRNTVESWRGITVARLRSSPDGVVWPAESPDAPERTGTIFDKGSLLTADGKLPLAFKALGPMAWSYPKGSPKGQERDEKYPLVLTQGKVVTQWQQTLTNYAQSLAQFSDGRYVQVHPDTARSLGVGQGDTVLIETATGSVEARAELTDTIIPGVIFTPSHFAGTSPFPQTRSAPINSILPNYWDRVSAQFNGVGCTLRRKG
jgi:formate dehydrogenase major subunit